MVDFARSPLLEGKQTSSAGSAFTPFIALAILCPGVIQGITLRIARARSPAR
jgi:hypothetical protein